MLHFMLNQMLQDIGKYLNKLKHWLGKYVAQNFSYHKDCCDCVLILQLHADSLNSAIYSSILNYCLVFWTFA